MSKIGLQRASDFVEENAHLFKSMASFYQHTYRHREALVACGAIVRSHLGLLVDVERYEGWLRSNRNPAEETQLIESALGEAGISTETAKRGHA